MCLHPNDVLVWSLYGEEIANQWASTDKLRCTAVGPDVNRSHTEPHIALLAIQSLNVIPMTDNELDQIVEAARIDLNLDLSVLVGPLNVDITGTIELGDDGPRIQVDVTNN
jgi:hypothetical protein